MLSKPPSSPPRSRARLGEVLKARWSDIDFERVWTKPSHHTKQKRTEHIPLSGPTLALLTEMREKADPTEANLLPGNASGRPLQDIKKFWKAVTEQAGIADYRLHDNRHTHASHLVSSGRPGMGLFQKSSRVAKGQEGPRVSHFGESLEGD
jgi:integrase